ncbi:MAG: cysteine hydrolase [Acidobacteria bacterium]|nr:cysteine hydrolase [Acidobacteriota bacterium]
MATTAVVIMDVQNGIVQRLGERSAAYLDTVVKVRDAARAAQVRVIYVRVAFRAGAPEISDKNQAFTALAGTGGLLEYSNETQIHERLAPRTDEVVVTKRRVSAFSGSDLDVVLRAMDIDTLVLCGISTSGVVLSTVRQAADLDFKIIVLADACADTDPEVHELLINKVFPRQTLVLDADEWIKQLVI